MNMIRASVLLLGLLAVTACGKKDETKKTAPHGTPVSVTQVALRSIEQTEASVGTLESPAEPVIAAEVAGKLLSLHVIEGQPIKAGQVLAEMDPQDVKLSLHAAQAEVQRLEALSSNDRRRLERMQQLQTQNFISAAGLEDVSTQASSSRNQLEAARAQLALMENNLGKTRIVSPLDGRVDRQIATPGQYLKVGDPIIKVVYLKQLRARLPFPETLASQIKPGMAVHLSSPGLPGNITGKIEEVRASSGVTNRSFDAIAVFDNPGWQPGATLSGAVVLGERADALVAPEGSVVLRPAGTVVYVVEEGKARQRIVEVGAKQAGGLVEIRSGIDPGETIVVDGAGFLTDQAPVTVSHQETPPAPAASK